MNLEELIYKRFTESKGLTKRLARFAGRPAVFSPEAPSENQEEWESNPQYPKIIYNFDLQANEERKSVGTLSVCLLCQNTGEVLPEAIEPEVRKCLRDVFLKSEEALYCFTWARTDGFTMKENECLTIGSEIRFDILEYPFQNTSDPDPVMAVTKYVKELYPECTVIGYDRMEDITETTKETPVLYCKIISADMEKQTNTVLWMAGRMAIHVLCPDGEKRIKMIAAITNNLGLQGEIIMLDRSPMFIRQLQANYMSDYLRDGQIFLTGHYGVLRYKAKPNPINATYIERV